MVQSPCINLCRIEAPSGLCGGCFRTLDEITQWSRLDDTARNQILAALPLRREQNAPTTHD